MADGKTDLRVIRTKQNIKQAFAELIKKKPLSKISVTELSKMAMINKGTFYLHYQDIYALYLDIVQDQLEIMYDPISDYNLFFDDPEFFVKIFFRQFTQGSLEDSFPLFFSEDFGMQLPLMMTEDLQKRLYATGRLKKSIENDIRLECAISCFFIMGGKEHKRNLNLAAKTFASVVRALFPMPKFPEG